MRIDNEKKEENVEEEKTWNKKTVKKKISEEEKKNKKQFKKGCKFKNIPCIDTINVLKRFIYRNALYIKEKHPD